MQVDDVGRLGEMVFDGFFTRLRMSLARDARLTLRKFSDILACDDPKERASSPICQ